MPLFKKMGMFPDIKGLTDKFDAKFGELVAKLDEIKSVLIEIRDKQAGQIGAGLAIIMVILVLAFVGLFAICTDGDDNSLGKVELVSHRYDDSGGYDDRGDDNGCWDGECYDGGGDGYSQRYDQNYGSRDDRNRNRRRNRGAFSPGPFQDSPVTICLPYSCNSGGEQSGGNRNDGRGNEPPPDEGGYA